MHKSIDFGSGPGAAVTALALAPLSRAPRLPMRHLGVDELLRFARPAAGLPAEVNEWRERNLEHVLEQADDVRRHLALFAETGRSIRLMTTRLSLQVARCGCDGECQSPEHLAARRKLDPTFALFEQLGLGDAPVDLPCPRAKWYDYGLASLRVVTNAGVGYIVDAWQNTVELEDMKYHGIGRGSTAAVVGDTDIETELTTEYQTNNTRATGSTTESASNIFRSVGTNTVDADPATDITEHGILSNATVGSGVLFDRHVFGGINLDNGDSLQSTYDATFPAGS